MVAIKKTVVIYPIMDSFIRKTWSILIENGMDASYSSALNFMLLIAMFEALRPEGLREDTRKIIWDFIQDREMINNLNLKDTLQTLEDKIKPETLQTLEDVKRL